MKYQLTKYDSKIVERVLNRFEHLRKMRPLLLLPSRPLPLLPSRPLPPPPSRPLPPPPTNTTNADKRNDSSEADSTNEGSECEEKEILNILNEKNYILCIKRKDRSITDTNLLVQLNRQLKKYDSKIVAQFKKRGQRTD